MKDSDLLAMLFGFVLLALGFLWEHRHAVATLIALALLTDIMNNLQAIAGELHFIEEVMKERFPEPKSEDDEQYL